MIPRTAFFAPDCESQGWSRLRSRRPTAWFKQRNGPRFRRSRHH